MKKIVIYLIVEEGHGQTTYPETEEYYSERRKNYIKKLRNTNSADTKAELENRIREIDKKWLESHDKENKLARCFG